MREPKSRRHTDEYFSWEVVTATLWSVVIAVMLLGATYHRLGRPAVEWKAVGMHTPVVSTVRLACCRFG